MLQSVQNHHFQALLGQTGTLHLPDGSALAIHIRHYEEIPSAKLRHSERMPFSLEFDSLEPTDFVDGLCALELPELGRVDDIFVSRVPPMGRDPQLGYFCISFN
ncbi:hypothetical protein KVG96_23780 [Pseudomonas sp. COR58]|uniref:DUF6916 domain-containing protein n=1 Tax=Pseudomonas ekonensis TaxID=2842353 RepID=A0ABS6PKH6_9PSED|nr:hypothetical protein [Pseudomonas ekonensis]MBV4460985.1 hypothetical protein [Pseudomonas ekonensis]